MVKVTQVRYGFTFNRSNYQSERIDLEGRIEDGESHEAAYLTIKAMVHELGGDYDTARRARMGAMATKAEGGK